MQGRRGAIPGGIKAPRVGQPVKDRVFFSLFLSSLFSLSWGLLSSGVQGRVDDPRVKVESTARVVMP